jgi:hypothetical protein
MSKVGFEKGRGLKFKVRIQSAHIEYRHIKCRIQSVGSRSKFSAINIFLLLYSMG